MTSKVMFQTRWRVLDPTIKAMRWAPEKRGEGKRTDCELSRDSRYLIEVRIGLCLADSIEILHIDKLKVKEKPWIWRAVLRPDMHMLQITQLFVAPVVQIAYTKTKNKYFGCTQLIFGIYTRSHEMQFTLMKAVLGR